MKRIFLLIDDDPIANLINKKIMQKVVKDEEIYSFDSGHHALLSLHQMFVNEELKVIILLDINMPQMNGWDFIEEVDREFPEQEIDIHMLSSSVDRKDREKSENYSRVRSYIVKPLSTDKVQEILDVTPDR